MKELILLVVDDDPLVIQSVKMALPDQWRMMATTNPKTYPSVVTTRLWSTCI